jgi:hypothetical protein
VHDTSPPSDAQHALPASPVQPVWHAFDYRNKDATAPPRELAEELVWIIERQYAEGVDLGYFDGYTFRTWGGSDDCHVTHWAEISYLEPPAGWDDDEDEDEDDD